MNRICPACCSPAKLFFRSRLNSAVRSDWAAVPANIEVWHCSDCGHLFKTPELIEPWINYQDYRMWDGHPNQDKMTFDTGSPKSRSSSLVEHLTEREGLRPGERVLDFGCSTGALLTLLGKGHAGFEVAEKYRDDIEALGCAFYTPSSPLPSGAFDWVTLNHVYEHLKNPHEDFKPGLAALKPGGRILIQVPDPMWQPTDFYVIDHYAHFSARSLLLSASRLGLAPSSPLASVLAGEFTGLFRRGPLSRESLPAAPSAAEMDGLLCALESAEATIVDLRASGKPCAIYGAGLVGTMLAFMLNGLVVAYADDNEAVHGSKLGGIPIVPLSAIDKTMPVVLSVPPTAAAAARKKCRSLGLESHALFLPAAQTETKRQ